MKKAAIVATLLLLATPAGAQVTYYGLSGVQTINGAIPDANGDVALAIPTPAAAVPAAEIVGGAIGSAMTFRRGDAVQPRISRADKCTTNSSGQCTLTWTNIGSASPSGMFVPDATSASDTTVPTCRPIGTTWSATGVTIQCFVTQTAVLGLLPYKAAASGIVVRYLIIPPST